MVMTTTMTKKGAGALSFCSLPLYYSLSLVSLFSVAFSIDLSVLGSLWCGLSFVLSLCFFFSIFRVGLLLLAWTCIYKGNLPLISSGEQGQLHAHIYSPLHMLVVTRKKQKDLGYVCLQLHISPAAPAPTQSSFFGQIGALLPEESDQMPLQPLQTKMDFGLERV